MTTDEMLIEIASYRYKSFGFSHVFMDYSQHCKVWHITWRNPVQFSNGKQTEGKTPNEACINALNFINQNPKIFFKPLKLPSKKLK